MNPIHFSKYQGTGNDFIMIDNRELIFDRKDLDLVRKLCHRKFGIGSDGLILIENNLEFDFDMIYFNPDGSQSLCGNGSRCAVMFARSLGIVEDSTNFLTIEGPLEAKIRNNKIHLQMPDVNGITITHHRDLFIHTGSPHYIQFVTDVHTINVVQAGKEIRYSPEFMPGGTNVNFVQQTGPGHIFVRTYERGVENETLSCGTGVTASALAAGSALENGELHVQTQGGSLAVQFRQEEKGQFRNIILIGPAEKVFDGVIDGKSLKVTRI
jgi:diaminopimelate epimerase